MLSIWSQNLTARFERLEVSKLLTLLLRFSAMFSCIIIGIIATLPVSASIDEMSVDLRKSSAPTKLSRTTVSRWISDNQNDYPGKNLVLFSENYASAKSRLKAHHLECLNKTLQEVKDQIEGSNKEFLVVRINDGIYSRQKPRIASVGLDIVQDPTKSGDWITNYVFSNLQDKDYTQPDTDWKIETSNKTIGLFYVSRNTHKADNILWLYSPLSEAVKSNSQASSICESENVQLGKFRIKDISSEGDLSLIIANQIQTNGVDLKDVKYLMSEKALTTLHVKKDSLSSSKKILHCGENVFNEVYQIAEVVPNFRSRKINADILDVGFSPEGECLTAKIESLAPRPATKKKAKNSQKSKGQSFSKNHKDNKRSKKTSKSTKSKSTKKK